MIGLFNNGKAIKKLNYFNKYVILNSLKGNILHLLMMKLNLEIT
jgi:hypothetical protein